MFLTEKKACKPPCLLFAFADPLPCFSDIYRLMTRRLLRFAVQHGDVGFLKECVSILLRQERVPPTDEALVLTNGTNPASVSLQLVFFLPSFLLLFFILGFIDVGSFCLFYI